MYTSRLSRYTVHNNHTLTHTHTHIYTHTYSYCTYNTLREQFTHDLYRVFKGKDHTHILTHNNHMLII